MDHSLYFNSHATQFNTCFQNRYTVNNDDGCTVETCQKNYKKSFQQLCSLACTEENAELKSHITVIKEKSIRLEQVSKLSK